MSFPDWNVLLVGIPVLKKEGISKLVFKSYGETKSR